MAAMGGISYLGTCEAAISNEGAMARRVNFPAPLPSSIYAPPHFPASHRLSPMILVAARVIAATFMPAPRAQYRSFRFSLADNYRASAHSLPGEAGDEIA